MSIQKIFPEDIEVFTLETSPVRSYVSSSTGVTGNVYLYQRRSNLEKEVYPLAAYSASYFWDQSLGSLLDKARFAAYNSGSNQADLANYLTAVNSQSISARKQQTQEIIRFTPGIDLGKDMSRKSVVANVLMPFYRSIYPTAHWGYTNYHCLNFFTSSAVPTGSVLLYPHSISVGANSVLTGSYLLPGAFSFDFWINPRYTTDGKGGNAVFTAGTILHLSSTYAVSLITGSSQDSSQYPNSFRVLLQLSTSAETRPSLVNVASLPAFAFVSDDNSLPRNQWSHVTIRWGTTTYNNGTGSFVVNGINRGTFVIPSSSILPRDFTGVSKSNPSVLCVGNFYEGNNNSNSGSLDYFFTSTTNTREGLTTLNLGSATEPTSYLFRHPLNAEVMDLKVYKRYLNNTEIQTLITGGASTESDLLFYLPPFFTRESPTRTYSGGQGGVLATPFFTKDGTTKHPFAVDMAFGVNGHYLNLENFVRDFATSTYPRLWGLSGSVINAPVIMPRSANEILYATASVNRRAVTVLPSDNGLFCPNFDLLANLDQTSFIPEAGSISLLDMYPTSSIYAGVVSDNSGSILRAIMGPDPAASDSLGVSLGQVPTILQRTRDPSSNQVCFFDISNLFYGNQISPGTFSVWDTSLSCSGGKVRITLKDDGHGNLYRADSTGSLATWNSVGSVFYNEGIVAVTSPHLCFFGQDGFGMTFKGQQNLHVLHINCMARPLMETSSSNPNYVAVSASLNANDTDTKFVYITDILIQDDNLNVIGRTKVAQPIVKRTGEKLLFKFKIDC